MMYNQEWEESMYPHREELLTVEELIVRVCELEDEFPKESDSLIVSQCPLCARYFYGRYTKYPDKLCSRYCERLYYGQNIKGQKLNESELKDLNHEFFESRKVQRDKKREELNSENKKFELKSAKINCFDKISSLVTDKIILNDFDKISRFDLKEEIRKTLIEVGGYDENQFRIIIDYAPTESIKVDIRPFITYTAVK